MGFTVRFMLGAVLVLLCCWNIEAIRLLRQSRQISENGVSNPTEKFQKIEDEKTTQQSIVANLNEEISKPKTDISTEANNIDKQNSLINKLEKSEILTKVTNQPEIKNTREDIARSIDIEKYVSNEFHNKNNVYTLPVSSDTAKYMDPEYDLHSTTRKYDDDHEKEFDFDTELTTPKSSIFDHKYKEAVESVEQKLEHIDDSHDISLESDSKELNLEKLYDETKNNDTKADLNYINYKNIISNKTRGKNQLHKDLVVEAGTNLDFRSSFNHTIIIDDENDNNTIAKEPFKKEKTETSTLPNTISLKGDLERSETSTTKSIILTTRKSLVLTKPPSNKNISHISILSNKIESETIKAIQLNPFITTEKPKGDEEITSEFYTKRTPLDMTKRGSVSFIDYGQISSTEPTVITNEIHKKSEQQVQENQVIPIHVKPPRKTEKPENKTSKPLPVNEEKATTETSITTETTLPKDIFVESSTVQEFNTNSSSTEMSAVSEEIVTENSTTREPTISSTEIPVTEGVNTENITAESSTITEATEIVTTTTEEIPFANTTETVITTTEEFPFANTTETVITTTKEFPLKTSYQTTTETEIETTTVLITQDTTITPMTTESANTTETSETTTPIVTEPTTTESSVITDAGDINQTNTSPTDFENNITTTTEETVRTSKGLIFRQNIITMQSDATTMIPTTEAMTTDTPTTVTVTPSSSSIIPERVTEEIPQQYETTEIKKEEKIITTDTVFVSVDNHTVTVTDTSRNDQTYPSEAENSTENNTISSDPYELNTVPPDDNSGTIAAITISSIGAVCLIILAGLLYVMRKRQKRFNYGQRCTPVSLDDYSMDNISVYNSVRRKGMIRNSKRSYGNPAFEDPVSVTHPLNFPALGKFATNFEDIKAEFEEIPQITARTNELPEGCDTKNRYANVIPLPETRVFLTSIDGYPNSDYINANYVTGPKNIKGYYIACQAPLQNTVDDFWRMIWEQQSKVILMLTHLFENGVEKCVDYLPPSEVLDCHRLFGDFQITLKKREVKDKYIISILQLKNMVSNSWREVTHFWYLGWPEKGVPTEANSLIAFLIEARSYMKSSSIDRKDITNGKLTNGTTKNELNPVVVHCSPGTGRTGVVIACDIAIREFEQTRLVDVPRIVYKIRRDRASAVQTKEQYAFIYKVINLYATKLTGGALDSL